MRVDIRNFCLGILILPFFISAQSQDNLSKLKEYVDDGQLVIYSESSIVMDSSSSAITYVDFCADGTYYYSYDGSYTVKGTQNTSNRNNRAYGAGVAENSGQWQILEHQNAFFLEVVDAYGQKTYYPINIQNLIAGKWKQGNVTYVFAPKQGRCQ
ncbi:hypothetical protein [Flagellimonas allohymeniacidonis]|uniref:Uncharacterized protein n=1 Tax=Flagellimonas allohymeniacidonis TaxID=2517819 RepID=A0A4Q8QAE6_9FLAO|nr:hypothetical protein [Allomuricauda hymeniacidonis]TAI47211.1 hypothetical protein EW142_11035 [Allomuricauda hymeniacidonis]